MAVRTMAGAEPPRLLFFTGTGGAAPRCVGELSGIDIDAALFKVDVYSFALLLWALWMRQEPYMHSGLNAFQLVQRVLDGVRPPMPPSMPPKMAQLVRDCWAGDPDARPSFTEIRKRLKDMRGDFFG